MVDQNVPLGSVPQEGNLLKDILLPSVLILFVITVGIGTGWKLSGSTSFIPGSVLNSNAKAPDPGKEVGSKDEKTFRDRAEGVMEKGGVDGEGTHHLTRDGGPSQNVYLTSSVVDLDQFVGKKVEVWGETFNGEKAGWLMDVGRIKVLE
ncbi:MAG: hypothetical protein HYU80_01750 [Candidatus Blackburnbacteria bacterium]|nr:hypothetical protein [Candidatus Blackburnbacteria bacterium]